jgi:hypothetical protein
MAASAAEFLERGAGGAAGRVSGRAGGEEAVENQALHLGPLEFGGERAAQQAAAFGGHGHAMAFGRAIAQQGFLGVARGLEQLGPLRGAEFASAGQQPFLGVARERGVHVVAAEHQMIAHGNTPQGRLSPIGAHLNEREIGGAAADVHHQHEPHAGEGGGQIVAMMRRKIVKGGLRLLDQQELLKPGLARGGDGERACGFVEGSGDGDDDFLRGQGGGGMGVVPSGGQMREQPGRRLDRRDFGHIAGGAPRQNGSRPVHAGVAQPALGGSHEPTGHAGALPAGEGAHDEPRRFGPRQLQRAGGQFVVSRQIQARRQQRLGGHLAGSAQLPHRKIRHRGVGALGGVGERHRAIGGAKVNADDERSARR